MKHFMLTLKDVEQVVDFVKMMSACPCEADVRYGSCVVDAKSLLGVLSLGVAKKVEVVLHSEEMGDMGEKLSAFAA